MRRLRVLVADDHYEMRCAIIQLLSKDHEVVGAVSTGDELVRSTICLLPDVIVSDIMMPVMDGLEARKQLAARQQEIPFVFVSGLGQDVQLLPTDSAVALVHKLEVVGHICRAVESVFAGRPYLSPYHR